MSFDDQISKADTELIKTLPMSYLSFEELLLQQRDQLDSISTEITEPTEKLAAMLDCIQANLKLCKEFVDQNGFANQAEEIYFFKTVKPNLYADKIFSIGLYQLNYRFPVGPVDKQRAYLDHELMYLERFFNLNSFYYQYYKSRFSELDHLYFLRGAHVEGRLFSEESPAEDMFCTALDYLFSKFIAYERLQKEIARMLTAKSDVAIEQVDNKKSALKWTGDSINLVEVAYGIWLTGQVNNGNASISEIIRWMEEGFQVNIGRAHRRWTEISQRKRNSYTKFIDRMQAAVIERIDNELAVKK